MIGRRSFALFGWLGLGVVAAVACSGTDSGGPRGGSLDAQPVVEAPWGSKADDVGRDEALEAAPEGPASFDVDAQGRIHLLDQLNERVLVFESGKLKSTTALPPRPFDDLVRLDAGYALLELHEQPAIVFVSDAGTVTSEVPLEVDDVPFPGLVTALVLIDDGLWVEVEQDYMVRIANTAGAAIPTDVLAGQILTPSVVLSARVEPPHRVEVLQQDRQSGLLGPFADVTFGEMVRERSLFARANGRYVLAVKTATESDDPEQSDSERQWLVVLDEGGGELTRKAAPVASGETLLFRSVRLGADGNVYVLVPSDGGVKVMKVAP